MRDEPSLPAVGFINRVRECDVLNRLVDEVRSGESRVLVIRGEAGIGKSALLAHLSSVAEGCHVARAAGVESEMELAFAGIHALCMPMLARIERLPGPQRDALGTAFGLTAGKPPDRFMVGLAVLSLLADAAEEHPVVCIVDDAQWLDRASAQTLGFVARRLLAERVGVVFAVRDPRRQVELEGLPELVVEGLPTDDARRLLDLTIPRPLDGQMRERILGEAAGNPLALLELPRRSTPLALTEDAARPGEMTIARRIEQGFVRELQSLPADAQRLLVLAAAEPLGDVPLLWRAAERLGITHEAAPPIEAASLVEIGARVRFRHPLVRSAAYGAASASERREAHRALAEATDPMLDADRRAWHRSRAAEGPDETVAGDLERSADRARARGGLIAAAAFLERAAELTPNPAIRVRRSLAAAEAKLEVADIAAASNLVAAAELGPVDALQVARLERLRAQITFAGQRGRDAPPLLLAAAQRLEALDTELARETYLEAIASAMFAGRLGTGPDEREVAEAVRAMAPIETKRPADLLLDALATRFIDGYEAAVAPLSQALHSFAASDSGGADQRWLWLTCRVAQDLWDDELWYELASRGVRVARETGALQLLANALNHLGAFNVHHGAFATAATQADEVELLTQATGLPPLKLAGFTLAGWRGELTPAFMEWGWQNLTARGEGSGLAGWLRFSAFQHNSQGRYGDALASALQACERDDVMVLNGALAELIEAGARSGSLDQAAVALERLSTRAQASGTEWALGVEARCRGLVTADESLYRESIDRLERSRAASELARSRLVYGEWLRRENRRVDARKQLREAHDMLVTMGAEAFVERARRELAATGETVRKRTVEARAEFTTQEAQVARLAADGYTNVEIGSQLYISPRTVEYHLHKVFGKLGISSRKELRRALPNLEYAALPA